MLLVLASALGSHAVAVCVTTVTVDLMRHPSAFATMVRVNEEAWLPYVRTFNFTAGPLVLVGYLWAIVRWERAGAVVPAPRVVERRVVSAAFVVALAGVLTWSNGAVFFPLMTLWTFGRWTPELMSQQILSPLVNGFLASATSYLTTDLIMRRLVVPRVFPEGGLADVPGAFGLSVRGRLAVFLVAVVFAPLFTLLGLVRAAAVRLDHGIPIDTVVPALTTASSVSFVLFLVLALALTTLLSRTFTEPLERLATVVRRVRAGDLTVHVPATSSDETGVLEDSVRGMVQGLREREHILQTFGRIVEPAVRDRLLAHDGAMAGEVRTAAVLVCDLRGFTTLAETTAPDDLVQTLNAVFTAIADWVRECHGSIDKFVGDGALAVFGLFGDATPAEAAGQAVRCALGLQARLSTMNARRTTAGEAPLTLKVGVHAGPVVAGIIGARDRHEYTVVGDTVNVAARLQELCREQGHDVLVSETAHRLAIEAGAHTRIVFTTDVALRGRAASTRVLGITEAC